MAVGLSFALSTSAGASTTLAAAIALAIGIGLQNFPEGAAISLPLYKEGCSRAKAFLYGALSGIVEPIAGIATVAIVGGATIAMPWLLSFAAGAMIYVVVEELIPEANLDAHSHARDLRCHDRVSDYDDHGCCLGIKRFLNYRRVLKKKQQKRVALTRFSLYCIRYFLQARRHPRSHT